jgi:hypothetical protein
MVQEPTMEDRGCRRRLQHQCWCDAKHGIAGSDLEARVLGDLLSPLVGSKDLLQTFTDKFQAELERVKRTCLTDETKHRRETFQLERSIARCLEFILSGEGTPTSVRAKLQELGRARHV